MSAIESFTDADGVEVAYRRWVPAGTPKAIVQIAHGASEHSERYGRFATYLNGRGYAVFANDHRGHGLTAKSTGVGKAGPRGWAGLVDDMREMGRVARADAGDVPLVLFGHSMGSFLAQRFAQTYGDELAGLVLSGSSGGMENLSDTVALLESVVAAGQSDDPAHVFGPLNAPFEPARTPFDWLSRDEAEVDRYVADPMCGDDAPLTFAFVHEMVKSNEGVWTPGAEAKIPKSLPILMITGEADPVSDGAKTVRELEARYRAAGISDVTALYYPEARHELLNETNRDEVQSDVADWLDRVTSG